MNAVHIRTSSRYWPGTCLVPAGSPRTKVWLNITNFTIHALCVTNESWGSFCMHWADQQTAASWALSRTFSSGLMLIKVCLDSGKSLFFKLPDLKWSRRISLSAKTQTVMPVQIFAPHSFYSVYIVSEYVGRKSDIVPDDMNNMENWKREQP